MEQPADIPPQKQPHALITKLTADKIRTAYNDMPEKRIRMVKTFSIDKESNKLKKGHPGIISSGEYKTFSLSLNKLSNGLKKFTEQDALCLGSVDSNAHPPKGRIGFKKWDGEIRRTKENFLYHTNRPTFCYIDIDGSLTPTEEILNSISSIVPGFSDAGTLVIPSSSSGLRNSNNELINDSTSIHIYFIVEDGADIPRFMDTLFDRLWLAGHGFHIVSKAPALLRRCVIDPAVSGAERIIYEGDPLLNDGITQDERKHILTPGGTVNTHLTKNLTDEEKEQLEILITNSKKKIDPSYQSAKKTKISSIAKEQNIPEERAKEIFTDRRNRIIDNEMLLYFGGRAAPIKAGEIFNGLGDELDGCKLADPLEPDYDGGSQTKAKFFWNNGINPVINSYAHGSTKYTFAATEANKTPEEKKKKKEKEKAKNDIERAVEDFNKNHAACLVSGTFVVIKETKDPITKGTDIDLLKIGTVVNFYKNKKVFIPDSKGSIKPLEVTNLWLGHENRRTCDKIVFDPSLSVPNTYFNLFRGFNRITPKKGDWSLFKNLILNDACSERQDLFEYVMAWFQNILRNPHKKSKVALVFYGGQGTGKGTVMDWFREIFQAYYLHLTNGNQLTADFNKQLFGRLLVFADEAIFTGDASVTNKMKGLITEDTMLVTYKGIDSITVGNFMNIVIATNNDHAIDAAIDERRYVAINFNDQHKQNRDYFRRIHEQKKNGGIEALLHHLTTTTDYDHIDISRPPFTTEINEQKGQSLGSIEAFWLDCLTREYILTIPNGDPDYNHKAVWMETNNEKRTVEGFVPFEWEEEICIRMDYIYDEYLLYCQKQKIRYPKSSISFWRKTKSRATNGRIFTRSYQSKKSSKRRCFCPLHIDLMRKEFDLSVVKIDWDDVLCCDFHDGEFVLDDGEEVEFDGQF